MKAIVEIKGGFGNQVFQIAFANHLKNLGFNVKVSLDHLNTHTDGIIKREIVVDLETFNLSEARAITLKLFRFFHRMSESKKGFLFYNIFIKHFFSKYSDLENFKSSTNKYLNYFDGYWQDIEILENEKEFLIQKLQRVSILQNSFKRNIKKGSTLVLVRRGDYIEMGEDLSINFYKNSINYCRENINNFNYEIFTDDVEWVKNQDWFKDASKIYPPSNNPDKILEIFDKMINFENYIVGNSTFSLIAAVLSENSNSSIIVAEPWFRNKTRNLKYKKSWIKIDNE